MGLSKKIIKSTLEVTNEILNFKKPSDLLLSNYFKKNRSLISLERKIVADAVYDLLRNFCIYKNYSFTAPFEKNRSIVLLALFNTCKDKDLGRLLPEEIIWIDYISSQKNFFLPDYLKNNFPLWLINKFSDQFGYQETKYLINSLNSKASLDLRVNLSKISRKKVKFFFSKLGINSFLTPFSKEGLRLTKKISLKNLSIFKKGMIEVQDEGSQLLSQVLDVKRGDIFVDYCAGAGGKTLAIGEHMRNSGRIYAFDISKKRLSNINERLTRSGLTNVFIKHIGNEKDTTLERLNGKVDKVLVDAPCSATGTIRRNPDLKWRLSPELISYYQQEQIKILCSASILVKNGGYLIYSTCSLLDQENERVVEIFLEKNPEFKIEDISGVLLKKKIQLNMGKFLLLKPHIHQTDGFFAAKFVKNNKNK